MSNIDYTQICPEFYTNYEDGCCMENCIYNDLDECPIHYVKGLLDEKDKAIENWQTMYESVMQTCGNDAKEIKRIQDQLALTEKAFQIAIFELDFAKNHSQSTNSETYERILNLRDKILKQAKEMMKSE